MSKKPAKPDDLIKSKVKNGEVELTEQALDKVVGGTFIKLDGIDGEAQDKGHKATIELASISQKHK